MKWNELFFCVPRSVVAYVVSGIVLTLLFSFSCRISSLVSGDSSISSGQVVNVVTFVFFIFLV
jgi:hypothetical protein